MVVDSAPFPAFELTTWHSWGSTSIVLLHIRRFIVGQWQNNALSTLAKVNYLPYGIDFPQGPTGRFCNGRTVVDVIAELLGFNSFVPPFATAEGEVILKGVNYASGGSGIRDEKWSKPGFKVTNMGCCGGQNACLRSSTPCQNRSEYAFWDQFHSTEAVNLIFGQRAYKSQTPSDAYPIDISTLAQL
ncbi:GDSL esterase/lipase [Vitis vinifera]|uniref:GDSL esterase/lipase n=1 Tax=Vitis vinifera TaxID=29760 RepID=A0A438CDP5_VITVI|nr:GDSL esterase/lipase [Vitis vinifera]